MQFTGLQDKHDTEIWEGDVVREYDCYGILHNHEVKYADGFFSPLVRAEEGHNSIDDYDSDEWEVLGNIYEHPELMKEATP